MVSGASLTKAAPPTPVDDSSDWRLICASLGEDPPQERNGDTRAVRRPHGPAVHSIAALRLSQDAAGAGHGADGKRVAA